MYRLFRDAVQPRSGCGLKVCTLRGVNTLSIAALASFERGLELTLLRTPERLDVGQHRPDLVVTQPVTPRRHSRAKPFASVNFLPAAADDVQENVVGMVPRVPGGVVGGAG